MGNIMPKILAVYLPQFHETEDNNIWWGKGFTDWESVKSSKPCFCGHKAPWVPLGKNYYDLNTHNTMKHQAELAKEYGIDGFSFYHYYFKDGKMELEKPAENLLKWSDIDMPFCFNWANESWIRSWSRIDGNVWGEQQESDSSVSDNGVLVLQDYGDEEAWKEHFYYLLPFFQDKRYIKIDNKPVFIFYRPANIKPLNSMIAYWRKLASKENLAGLYLIGVNMNITDTGLDASMIYEPRHSINSLNSQNKAIMKEHVRCFDYSDIWNEVISSDVYKGCKTFFTGVSGYDDTPRRGKSGECFINRSISVFCSGLEKLIKKSISYGNELVFINAWNEWGEGMYLEPDEENRYAYLNAVKTAKINAEGALNSIDICCNNYDDNSEIAELIHTADKYRSFMNIFDKWLYLVRGKGCFLKEYLDSIDVNTVAVYGMATTGKQLYSQLIFEGISVLYGIDRYVGRIGKDLVIYRPEAELPEVDAIIISAYDYQEISDMLKAKTKAKLLSLEQIIDSCWKGNN